MEYSLSQLRDVGLLVFGRRTYDHMATWWPTPEAKESDPYVAELMNSLPKVVFSDTLHEANWERTEVVRDAPAAMGKLADRTDKLVMVLAVSLTAFLLSVGLIDELRIMVNPVVLGRGRPLFPALSRTVPLELVRTITFASGNVLLCYRPLPGD